MILDRHEQRHAGFVRADHALLVRAHAFLTNAEFRGGIEQRGIVCDRHQFAAFFVFFAQHVDESVHQYGFAFDQFFELRVQVAGDAGDVRRGPRRRRE